MKWNDSQRTAIEARGKNILVSAAAGSGKTAVLTERIKQLIVKDGVSIDDMLIVTFTNAAAGEMRERIARAIGEGIREGKSSLREQLTRLGSANISTFHAFCLEVVRQHFYLIDVKPNARICDEAQKMIVQEASMDELIEESFMSGDDAFLAFLHKYASSRDENEVRKMILSVYNFILSIPDPFGWLNETTERLRDDVCEFTEGPAFQYVFRQIEIEVDRSINYFAKVIEITKASGIESIFIKAQKDMDAVCSVKAMIGKRDYDLLLEVVSNIKFETFSAKKDEKAAFEMIKEEVKFLRDKAKGIIRLIAEKYLYQSVRETVDENKMTYEDARCLQNLVKGFHQIYAEKKEEKGLIDFNDAEHFALKVLENPQVAAEYRDKFEYIFVDEYQDINVVQETLISRIKRENNLFMVGDVKQSIYRFRLAEPEIFMEKYEKYKEALLDSTKIDLNQNFRSKSGVIDFTNMVFSNVMTKQSCGMNYDADACLYKGSVYEGPLEYPAQVYVVDMAMESFEYEDDPIQNLKKTEIEALTAVRIIKETVGTLIYDDKKAVTRKMSYRDIAVLFRAMKEPGAVYQEVFARENIPVYTELEDGYFDTIEIGSFLNLLRVIDNKRQDLPLISVLYSGIFGFSINDLVKIRLMARDMPFHEVFFSLAEKIQMQTTPAEYEYHYEYANEVDAKDVIDGSIKQKLTYILEKICEWKQLSQLMPLEDFLWELMQDSGYYEYVAAMPKGAQRAANLRTLVDKAAAFQSGAVKNLFSFITYVEQLRKTGAAWQQAKLLGENDDVVRLMTVHKSKGLEFPAVIVTGLGRRCNMTRESYKISLHRDMGMGLRCVEPENYSYRKTFIQRTIEQRERMETLAEEMRVLYVAFTRAKDKLILLGTMKDAFSEMQKYEIKGTFDPAGADKFFDWIIPAMMAKGLEPVIYNRADVSTYQEQVSVHRENIKDGIQNGFALQDQSVKDLVYKRLSWQYPFREAAKLASKLSVSEISHHAMNDHPNIPELTLPKELASRAGTLTAAERGTAMHHVILHLDFKKPSDIKSIAQQIENMMEKELLTEEEAKSVNPLKIKRMLESDIGKRMCAADKIHREIPFNLKKTAKSLLNDIRSDKDEILIQGAIDCYFEEGITEEKTRRHVLVDYKTDWVNKTDDLIQRYRPQLALYKEALEEIKGITVDEVYLYFFSIDQAVPVYLIN